MTTLREQIKDKHDLAEHSPFAKLLLSGNITKEIYADYLSNQYECYNALENAANNFGLFNDFSEIVRANLIKQDFLELNIKDIRVYPSTMEYVAYINSIKEPKLILAHVYVRHFADMYGGQIIKSKVPSTGKMYQFDDRSGLISKVREKLTEDLGNEANKCFEFAIKLFKELSERHNI
jgi:heme oxygenase